MTIHRPGMAQRFASGPQVWRRPQAGGATWWDNNGAISGCVAAYQSIGAASYTASKVNLKNPGTYDLTSTDDPAWDATDGWTFNGTSDRLTGSAITQLNGSSAVTIAVRVETNTLTGGDANLRYIFAQEGTVNFTTAAYQLRLETSADNYQFVKNGASEVVNSTSAAIANHVLICVYNGSNTSIWKNGTQNTPTSTTGATGTYATSFGIGYYAATPSRYWSGKIQAIAIYNAALSSGEIATVYAAMAAL